MKKTLLICVMLSALQLAAQPFLSPKSYIEHALEETRNRPRYLTEERADTLFLSPGVIDTVRVQFTVLTSNVNFIPFTGDWYIEDSMVAVQYNGNGWREDGFKTIVSDTSVIRTLDNMFLGFLIIILIFNFHNLWRYRKKDKTAWEQKRCEYSLKNTKLPLVIEILPYIFGGALFLFVNTHNNTVYISIISRIILLFVFTYSVRQLVFVPLMRKWFKKYTTAE